MMLYIKYKFFLLDFYKPCIENFPIVFLYLSIISFLSPQDRKQNLPGIFPNMALIKGDNGK
jgi:hypothetical protein